MSRAPDPTSIPAKERVARLKAQVDDVVDALGRLDSDQAAEVARLLRSEAERLDTELSHTKDDDAFVAKHWADARQRVSRLQRTAARLLTQGEPWGTRQFDPKCEAAFSRAIAVSDELDETWVEAQHLVTGLDERAAESEAPPVPAREVLWTRDGLDVLRRAAEVAGERATITPRHIAEALVLMGYATATVMQGIGLFPPKTGAKSSSTKDAPPATPPRTAEATASYSDAPIVRTDAPADQDLLDRDSYAEALAVRLTRLWGEANSKRRPETSFITHLYAPWGAGKSSLLKLLQAQLESRHPEGRGTWLVVHFNAWRHQHVEPVWWALYDQVSRVTSRESLAAGWLEWFWRFRVTSARQWIALVLTVGAAAVLVWSLRVESTLGSFTKWLSACISIAAAVWSGSLVLTRSLVPGSARAARQFEELGPDPLEEVRRHFASTLQRVSRPVVVFVDDLDRCKEAHVVQLLESIQTLFNNGRIFYVVAADRRWVSSCFEVVYEKLGARISEPGRSIGFLFLDKIFQLAVPVPAMSKATRDRYLGHLLTPDVRWAPTTSEEDLAEAMAVMQQAKSEEDLNRAVENAPTERRAAYQAAHVRRAASADIETLVEHRLRRFAPLMDANPRAMKLLVTAYGMYDAHARVSGVNGLDSRGRDKLALWTILSMRWPSLAEYLAKYPDEIDVLRSAERRNQVPKETRTEERRLAFELAERVDVSAVLQGGHLGVRLDAAMIRELAGRHQWADAAAVIDGEPKPSGS